MLHVTDLSFGFGEKPLYEGVNFRVSKGQKVGLVGPNGSGKSTLFSIIKGEENGFTGSVKVNATVGLVPQEIKYDAIMENSKIVRNYVDSENKLIDFEITKMFKGLELKINLDHDPKTLSGGQKTKLALARALFQNPDLLLLDEPTNFMDKEGKAWVMKFLANYHGAIIVISHDLELMDTAIDKILAVTPYNSTIVEYKGSVDKIIKEYLGGLASGMTYIGADTIEKICGKADFIEMSSAGLKESIPHLLLNGNNQESLKKFI